MDIPPAARYGRHHVGSRQPGGSGSRRSHQPSPSSPEAKSSTAELRVILFLLRQPSQWQEGQVALLEIRESLLLLGSPGSHMGSTRALPNPHLSQQQSQAPASPPHSAAPLPAGSHRASVRRVCIVSGRQTGVFSGLTQHSRTIHVELLDLARCWLPRPHWSRSPASPCSSQG